ncbi:hypothetical protein [Brachyspira murdochii]|uniref:Uncharacterized protein n=1 Tax=Brachyspira murdochii TaxID=84378 RepID=A0ABX5B3K3_9SPIR|nr:hypothetical protein [Brachyspira murdochii]PPS21865.1 hypothetical protein DJ52_08260 [Brachyspira murdochii]
MIVAIVQGKDRGLYDTVIDGEVVSGKEQQDAINKLLSKIPPIKITGNGGFKLETGEFFCHMQHPEKDVEGRYRVVLIVLDKNTSEEIIKETIKAIGCDYYKYVQIRNEINNEKKTLKKIMMLLGVFLILVAVMLF